MKSELSIRKIDILLDGYAVFSSEKEDCTVYFKGSVHQNNAKLDPDVWANSLIRQSADEGVDFGDYLVSEIKQITGLFSLVIRTGNDVYITADMIRSQPVLYGFRNNTLIVTNNLIRFEKQSGPLELSPDRIEEYVASGHVYGNGTVFKDFYGIQAGEQISIRDSVVTSRRYFEYKPAKELFQYKSLSEFTAALEKVLLSAFSRMIEQTPDVNRWIIPLSGGHDSRMLANCLYRLGVRNVLCFTYGIHKNEQSDISRQVAETLGYEWHFIEYTEKNWGELHKSGNIDRFIEYTFNGVSTPHFQDFLAVYELMERKILKKGDVFLPGHTGDFTTGCNFEHSDLICTDKSMAVNRTVKVHTKSKDMSVSPVRTIEKIFDAANVAPRRFQEYFNWQELRSKFTVNSLRTYEFFGFEARLPYWDKDIINFWLSVPDEERMNRKIYLAAEKDGILVEPLKNLPFFGKKDIVRESKIENRVKKFLPGNIKTVLLKITRRKVKYNAGLNQIFALKAEKVIDILRPVEDFPAQTRPYFRDFLERFSFQIDYHFLASLYTLRMLLDRYKHPGS